MNSNMINAMAQDLIKSLDEVAFEESTGSIYKVEAIQNLLYQYSQIKDANSIRADEATMEERELYNGFRK